MPERLRIDPVAATCDRVHADTQRNRPIGRYQYGRDQIKGDKADDDRQTDDRRKPIVPLRMSGCIEANYPVLACGTPTFVPWIETTLGGPDAVGPSFLRVT